MEILGLAGTHSPVKNGPGLGSDEVEFPAQEVGSDGLTVAPHFDGQSALCTVLHELLCHVDGELLLKTNKPLLCATVGLYTRTDLYTVLVNVSKQKRLYLYTLLKLC